MIVGFAAIICSLFGFGIGFGVSRAMLNKKAAPLSLDFEIEKRVQARTSEIEYQLMLLTESEEKARQTERLKLEFLTNVSHEVRTPLNAIIGFSNMMLSESEGPLTPEQKTDLEMIEVSGQHLLELMNHILDAAKLEANQMELHPVEVNLSEVLTAVDGMTQGLLRDKKLGFEIKVAAGLPAFQADPLRLKQMLLNLIANAIKFTEYGKISLSVGQKKEGILFAVSDTGIGIHPSKINLIFDRFTQVDGSTGRASQGVGLGLALVKEMTQLHAGKVWVESVPKKGSTFFIWLPLP